jgi:AcrR family transcriptional regulator
MTDGRRARGEATREHLLAVAQKLFGELGYEHTSIEDILTAAGVTRGALYHHFASKTDLFDAVVEALLVQIARETDTAARDGETPLERLRAGSHAWLQMALDPAVRRIALLDPPTVLGWTRLRALDEKHSLGALRASFRRLARERRIPAGQDELLAHMLLAALNEAALYIAYADDKQAALGAASATVDTVINRLAGQRAASLRRAGSRSAAR